jgi:mutator protein MutT
VVKEVRTAGTIIECDGKILIVHRREDISQGGTWGLPAGRVEPGESEKTAAIREVFEETGLKVNDTDIEQLGTFDWHFPEVTVIFPTFKVELSQQFNVKLNPKEHSEFKWVTPEECYKMKNLIHGFHDLLEKIYGLKK